MRSLTTAPGWTESRTGPFLVESSARAGERAEAVESLEGLETRLRDRLRLETSPDLEPIRVLVLEDKAQLDRLMRNAHPELPSRRAFFLADGNRRTIYTFQGDRLQEDLQHEATHALLHATVGVLPLWLDEGLAEYFEVNPRQVNEARNRARELLAARSQGWTPGLARLESIRHINDFGSDDYREAWAWAHFLLEGPDDAQRVLRGSLLALQEPGRSLPDVSRQLRRTFESPDREFWAHLTEVANGSSGILARSQSPAPLEDAEVEPLPLPGVYVDPAPRPRPSLIQRTGRFFSSLFSGGVIP